MLAPTQRTFDPVSKAWKLDLLALPLMLENLLPLGYNEPKRLQSLASLINDVDSFMYGEKLLTEIREDDSIIKAASQESTSETVFHGGPLFNGEIALWR